MRGLATALSLLLAGCSGGSDEIAQISAEDLWQEVDSIDQEIVEAAHAIGARVIAWTANEPTQWKTLYTLGVDGICTDRIAELATFSWKVR